ncbi:MAG: ABC transporter substrate-binding protein [Acetobacteraceae bacterium]|nr:ABC transporter substrate-binding protein [Acetobacteraceae bacterium]
MGVHEHRRMARIDYISSDFSSYIVQAQASGADVIALANSGTDTTNSVEQAIEFGVGPDKTKLVALLAFITQFKSLGLDRAKGLLLTESFYWDLNDETRAWSKPLGERFGGRMPSMAQAAVDSGVSHYVKAMAAAGTRDGRVVADKMRELPVNDFMMKNRRARKDGRIVHDFYLFDVKAPEESKGPWDLYKLIRTIPAADVTAPDGSTGCPF